MPTAWGYIRQSNFDERSPARLTRHRAALVAALAEYAGRGYEAGEIVTDGPDEMRRPVAARPGGFRVGRLAQPGDVILTPTAARLARSVAELRDTLERWHAAGVAGVVLDLALDYARPEARAALALMEAGASLDKSITLMDARGRRTGDEALTTNRWGLSVTSATRKGTIVPAEFELAARCAAWVAGGASYELVALHLTRTREPLPARWHKRNRTRFKPAPFWQAGQVRKMAHSYHVVSGLFARGAVGAPKGYTPPTAVPAPLPPRSTTT